MCLFLKEALEKWPLHQYSVETSWLNQKSNRPVWKMS